MVPPVWLAVGVGHNPDAFSPVLSPEGTSRKTKRPRFVTFGFQVSETAVKSQVDEVRNVFSNDPTGPCFGNKAAHFRPEVTRVRLSPLPTGDRVGLTGKAASDEVDCWETVLTKRG